MNSSDNHPVDSTNISEGAGIPDVDLDRLIAATIPVSEGHGSLPAMTRHDLVDVGPATPPPSWCLPDETPEWMKRLVEGVSPFHAPQVCVWDRQLDGVCITGEDEVVGGRVLRAQPRIHLTTAPDDGLTAAQARTLAAQMINAADLIDQAVSR